MEDSRLRKEAGRTGAGKTPARRPALRVSFIEEHQRRRMVGAVAELAHEFGIAAVTTGGLAQRAHMGKNTLYARFGNQAGCLSYAFAVAYREVFAELGAAAVGSEPWLERLDAGLAALFKACATEPLLAELCLAHAVGAPAAAADHDFEAAVGTLAELLAGGRAAGRSALGSNYREPPPEMEELLSRGILSLVRQRVLRGAAASLPAERQELVLWSAHSLLGPGETALTQRELRGLGRAPTTSPAQATG